MTALLLPITAVAHLFCDWLTLGTQIPLPFALMIRKVYLKDKGQECIMATELSKT